MTISRIQTFLTILIACLSLVATYMGIFTSEGPGKYLYESIRGEQITIYGKGLYKHMSAEVAIQGIAQDYVTLFIGVPLLLLSMSLSIKGFKRWNYIYTGVIGYFFTTYLFYLNIAMYNSMFLVYVALLGLTFFTLLLQITYQVSVELIVKENKVFNKAGIFLMINAVLIVLLWLSVILPPLFDGTIIPKAVEHYTSLPVQGFDLAIFLPLSFVSGYLAWKSKPKGKYFALIYCIALTILMIALCSKILFMGMNGANIIPVIFIMPTIALITLYFSIRMIKSINIV